jgi:hypothetical protein
MNSHPPLQSDSVISIDRGHRFLTKSALVGLLFAGCLRVQALDVIDPTGTAYINVTNSSQFAAAWGASNLFSQDVSFFTIGQTFGGVEWAKAGSGSAYVAFEVDQIYSVGSIFWAQRNGSTTGDNMQLMSIWASDSTPFTAGDPGVPPQNVIPLQANVGASVWREYTVTNIMSGRYFLMFLQQTPGNITGNPGGNEMRLGLNPPPTPPSVVQAPVGKTIYTGGAVFFEVTAAGSVPMTFQWYKDGVALQNGVRVSGATSTRVKISNLVAGDIGNYYVAITNAFGGLESASAALALTAAPTVGYPAATMTNLPVAYWQLNEASGTIATDYFGGFNGTYGALSVLGADGPRPADQPGFANTNIAVQTTAFTVDSAVALPPLNLGTNNRVTITAWVKPDGAQNQYAGIVFSRSGGTIAGLSYDVNGANLAYQWAGNRVNFPSGLAIPSGQWSMITLVVTPTNATLYCGTNQTMRTAVDVFNQPVQTFGGTTMIGLDVSSGEAARTFNGAIDEVAIYDRALTEAEVLSLFAAGVGTIILLPVEIATQPTNQALFTGETLALNTLVNGTPPISYQWYFDNSPISGATNKDYVFAGVRPQNAGQYFLIASNQANAITSSVVEVTVSTNVLRVLDPKGFVYTNVLASSVFGNSSQWGPTNLFKTDVTSLALGAVMTTEGGGREWAKAGSGAAYVSFEVDQIYDIASVYWSQRVGSGTGDNMQVMSVWASETTPFAAADPGTSPNEVIALNPNSGNPVWTRYLLSNQLRGRYFLLYLEQTTLTGNPGGSEMRLGAIGFPEPLSLQMSGANPVLSWPTFGTLEQADQVTGPWITASGITNGGPLAPTAPQKFFRVKYY